jgi:hypothetical protein
MALDLTRRLHKKICDHVKKTLLRRGYSKKILNDTMVLDGATQDFYRRVDDQFYGIHKV